MGKDLKSWVEALVERDGTVLHLAPGQVPLARVGGQLEPIGDAPVDTQTFVQALHAVCGEKESGVLHSVAGGGQMLHGQVLSDAGRRTLVLRRLTTPETDREKIGLPDVVWDTVAGLKSGLVLVTGEPGNGVSTTCAALTSQRTRDTGAHALVTGEPLTWRLIPSDARSRITHSICGVDTHGYLASGVAATAAEFDVDIVCCAPARGPYTTESLAEAATQGLLVIAGLQAASVSDLFSAWAAQEPNDRQATLRHTARALQLVIHQALVPRADGDGRVLASGVLLRTPAVYNLIREDRAHQMPAMMAVGGKLGMRTLEQHLETLVKDGTVTKEAAIAAHPEPWTARGWLERSDPATPPSPQP